MLRKSFADPDRLPPPELVRAAARALRNGPDPVGLRRDMLSVERAVDWAATERDLPLVQSPALIVWGDRDRYLPVRLVERFTRALPQATTEVVAGAGHSVHDDRPVQTVPLIRQFLADAGQTTPRDGKRQP